jgi:hypothetical protein
MSTDACFNRKQDGFALSLENYADVIGNRGMHADEATADFF